MRKVILLLTLGCISFSALPGQTQVRRYATQQVDRQLRAQIPDLGKEKDQLETTIKEFKLQNKLDSYTIPVVFHIVYKKGQIIPTIEQVLHQLESLNTDFQSGNTVAKHLADTREGFLRTSASVNIRFCLAEPLYEKDKKTAIQFIETNAYEWKADDAIKLSEKGGADPWDTKKHLNIWVGYLSDGISGYAQFPGGPAETDGIVIDSRFFGVAGFAKAPYDGGKTLTHLAGNYLGLKDLWDEERPCGDDGVDDTPVHNAPNYGQPGYRHISLCGNYPVEMTMNFMDNTDDAAQYMFTLGQKYRMQAVLSSKGPRAQLSENGTSCAKENELMQTYSLNGNAENPISEEVIRQWAIAAYPNPAGNEFHLEFFIPDGGEVKFVIYSALGEVMASKTLQTSPGRTMENVNCKTWPPGVYFIHAVYHNQQTSSRILLTKN